jgi:hypothetical protein
MSRCNPLPFTSEESKKNRDDSDRAVNIVISGKRENRDNSLWRARSCYGVTRSGLARMSKLLMLFVLVDSRTVKPDLFWSSSVQYGTDAWSSAGDAS